MENIGSVSDFSFLSNPHHFPKVSDYSIVPDAGQPVSDEGEGTHEEEEDGGSILRVTIQLPGYADQSQETRGFQKPNESGGLRTKSMNTQL